MRVKLEEHEKKDKFCVSINRDLANIVNKSKIKFPLETYTYNSKQELIKEIVGQNKNILSKIINENKKRYILARIQS
jgi:hypothetical protein